MDTILILLLVYFAYLLLWFVINLVIYFISLASKSPKAFQVLKGMTGIVIAMLNLAIGLWMLWFGITLLLEKEILWFIFFLLIGVGILTWLITVIQIPFFFILSYFSEKIEKMDFSEAAVTTELLDEQGKVVSKVEGDMTISARMARYFIALYLLNLLFYFIYPEEGEGVAWLRYVLEPLYSITIFSLVVGIPYTIYHKIRYKTFFTEDKRIFFIKIWKFSLYLSVALIILALVLQYLIGT